MIIDDSLVLKYLSRENVNNISRHWVFQNIVKGKHLFEVPDDIKRYEINQMLINIKKILLEFKPLNEEIYSTLYPEWKSIVKDMNVLLVVGCPSPYDAMVRVNEGKEYIIFDLIRFYDYNAKECDFDMLVRKLITHEASHLCLHMKYPVPTSENFIEQLKYIVFDESFAHLLSFKDNIRDIDWDTIIKEYYNKSLTKLKEAMQEKDYHKQVVLLEQSNSGSYWDKFASISGKLFLANHLEIIEDIYNGGINNFITLMLQSI